jgi:hypothetical protein
MSKSTRSLSTPGLLDYDPRVPHDGLAMGLWVRDIMVRSALTIRILSLAFSSHGHRKSFQYHLNAKLNECMTDSRGYPTSARSEYSSFRSKHAGKRSLKAQSMVAHTH